MSSSDRDEAPDPGRLRILIVGPLRPAELGPSLSEDPRVEVVAETESLNETVELTRRLKPDVVLLDPTPAEVGEDEAAIQKVREISAYSELILLVDPPVTLSARFVSEIPVSGFIDRTRPVSELVATIFDVATITTAFDSASVERKRGQAEA